MPHDCGVCDWADYYLVVLRQPVGGSQIAPIGLGLGLYAVLNTPAHLTATGQGVSRVLQRLCIESEEDVPTDTITRIQIFMSLLNGGSGRQLNCVG